MARDFDFPVEAAERPTAPLIWISEKGFLRATGEDIRTLVPEERKERLWSLFREIEAEQDEYENIPWGVVRNVKSFDLLVVEHSLKAILRPRASKVSAAS